MGFACAFTCIFRFLGNYDRLMDQINVSDCAVIGINDYCTVEGYKEIRKRFCGDKTLLPVVELWSKTTVLVLAARQNSNWHQFQGTAKASLHFPAKIIWQDAFINVGGPGYGFATIRDNVRKQDFEKHDKIYVSVIR